MRQSRSQPRAVHSAVVLVALVVASTIGAALASCTSNSGSGATSTTGASAAHSNTETTTEIEADLRRNTQALLDAIAPGDVKVWDALLDSTAIQVDENDVVRDKKEILAGLQPLGAGLVGSLAIDAFRVVTHGDMAVVTHEDAEKLDYHGQMILSRFRNTDTWLREGAKWQLVASQVLAVLQDPPAVHLDPGIVCAYAGRYEMTHDIAATLACAGDSLVMKRDGRPDRVYRAELRDVFFEPGQPRTRRIFQRDANGAIVGFVDRREARDITWKRVGR